MSNRRRRVSESKPRCATCNVVFTPASVGVTVCDLCDGQLALPLPPTRDARGRFVRFGGAS